MMSTETYEIFDRISVKTGLKDKWKEEWKEELKGELKEERDRENAINMLNEGLSSDTIARILNMSVSWVEDLKKQLPVV